MVNDQSYTLEDYSIKSSTRRWNLGSLVVRSIGGHWSAGGWFHATSSTYNNEKYAFELAPALEYNVFPYGEATRKSFLFLYRLNIGYSRYLEETLFGKTKEWLWSESLTSSLNLVQPWGTIDATIVGSHYFHDFSKNRLSFYGGLSLRVWKGFNVVASGSFSKIKDQISLTKGELTDDQILLRLKELSTSFYYRFSIGFNYSFGSSLSRAVNPRFDNGGIYD